MRAAPAALWSSKPAEVFEVGVISAALTHSHPSGYLSAGEEALAIGVYAALSTEDPNVALLLAVNHSGDSDSTGAICGNIVGARHGLAAIRPDWLTRLELRPTIDQLATDAFTQLTDTPPTTDTWFHRYPPNPST